MNTSHSDTIQPQQKKTEEKKAYQTPKIVYREALEVSASVCTGGKDIISCSPMFS